MKKNKTKTGVIEVLTGDGEELEDADLCPGFNGYDCDSITFDWRGYRYYVDATIINRSETKNEFELIPALKISRRKL